MLHQLVWDIGNRSGNGCFAGAGGDWLPAAHFLLLFQAITSFELRSRSGLYASIGLSGAILFLASQHAVDPFFGIFLTGFATLLLAFFAVSFLADQLRDVEVRWFGSRFSFGWFWCVVLSVALAVSLGVFLLLPKGLSGTEYAAHASALPVRATAPTAELEALARSGPVDVQGPLNQPDDPASDDTPKDADASVAAAPDSVPSTEPPAVDGPATVPQMETA
ncbi:MAG: hypothetical protein IH942_05010, partial [Acidobacteria bacterium]|nr:hypothetical protein [Acidobacteriota bacterium]